MTTEAAQYESIIIGTGQGGKPLARALANAGQRTAIIEKGHVGGTCVNVGCTPTKTMVASARVAWLARRSETYGVQAENVLVNLPAVVKRKQSIVEDFRSGSQKGLEKTDHLDLIFGEASFTGPNAVVVKKLNDDVEHLTAPKIFINTGGRPALPNLPGLDEVDTLDSTSIMELDTIPQKLLILGGGYIGLEFGQMFQRFGSDVTIIQRGGQLLPREDEDVAEAVAEILTEDGAEVILNANAVRVEKGSGGEIKLTISVDGSERTLIGSHLLLATGRVPNTDELNLQAAGVETDDRGFVRANDRLETNVEGIYAIGDVKGGPAFTHIAYDDYRVLETNLLRSGDASIKRRQVPYTVFIDPQLGRIGLSEREAKEQDRKVKVAKIPMTYVARALETDETRGFMKAIVDEETDEILGCAMLGIEGGELMTMIQIAMLGKVTASTLREAIYSHPGLAESFNTLFATYQS